MMTFLQFSHGVYVVKKIFQFLSRHFISVCLSIPSQATKVIMQRVISCFCSAVSAVVSEVACLRPKYMAVRSWWPDNEWWPAKYCKKAHFYPKKCAKLRWRLRSKEGASLVVECDEAAAEMRLLQSMTLQWPQQSQHHRAADYCIVTTLSFIQRIKYARHLFMRTAHYWNTIIPLREASQEFFEMMIFSWTAGLFKTLSDDGVNTRVDVGCSQSSLLVISWIFVAIYSGKNYLHIFIRQGKLEIFTLSGGEEKKKWWKKEVLVYSRIYGIHQVKYNYWSSS